MKHLTSTSILLVNLTGYAAAGCLVDTKLDEGPSAADMQTTSGPQAADPNDPPAAGSTGGASGTTYDIASTGSTDWGSSSSGESGTTGDAEGALECQVCDEAGPEQAMFYSGRCGSPGAWGWTPALTCEAALDSCLLNMDANPGSAIYCEWNGRELARRDDGTCTADYGPQDCELGPTCDLDDPCVGTEGIEDSLLALQECLRPLPAPFLEPYSCEEARTRCFELEAELGPGLSCIWRNRILQVGTSADGDACELVEGC